jgi:hypothetical protein
MSPTPLPPYTVWVNDRSFEARLILSPDGTYHVTPDVLHDLLARAGFRQVAPPSPEGAPMSEHQHEWINVTNITDRDETATCRDCGAVRTTTPTGRTTITTPDQRKVTGL